MIISGGARSNWRFFARHLMRTDENERVRVEEIRGLAGETPREALREMDALASGTRCKDFFYHANLNPREDEHLTQEQWDCAVDRLEKNLGLDGQSRIVVEHEKQGRTHRHVIWSRIDPDTMTAISDSHNYAKHAATSRELEREFHLSPVRGVLAEPDGPRPERRPKNWETFRGHKSGIDPHEVKAEVTQLWQESDSGMAFRTALAQNGYALCKGDKRDFLIVDPAGQEHSLARRIDGARAKDVREKLRDVERETLPTPDEARAGRRGDKKRVLEAVELGADKHNVERAINAGRAAEVTMLPEMDGVDATLQQQESYERTFARRREHARGELLSKRTPGGKQAGWQEREESRMARNKANEPER
jgi:hypothetical protein